MLRTVGVENQSLIFILEIKTDIVSFLAKTFEVDKRLVSLSVESYRVEINDLYVA
jgi:hypothetical protein